MSKRLTELKPRWVSAGGTGVTQNGNPVPLREGVGLMCDCPCGCEQRLYVPFINPMDGGAAHDPRHGWTRKGDTFDTLSLSPSILRVPVMGKGCNWYGFITDGACITC